MKSLNERIEGAEIFLDKGRNRRKYFNGILIGTLLALSYPSLNKITEYKVPSIQEFRKELRKPYNGRRDDVFSLEAITDDSLRIAVVNHYNDIKDSDVEKVVGRIDGRFRNIIDHASDNYNLDPILVKGLAYQESTGDPRAISPKGALGLMQIMPNTVYEIIRKYLKNDKIKQEIIPKRRILKERVMAPKYNIEMGASYLSGLIDMYDGNVILGLAAYNLGPSEVNGILKMASMKPEEAHWHKIKYLLPRETREFIPKVFSKALKIRENYMHNKDKTNQYH